MYDYSGHLKDYALAEKNYKKAIESDPYLPQLYIALANFYWIFDTDQKEKAKTIIESGLVFVPDDVSLKNALQIYSK